ncbi:MAG: ATPase [Campylobacterales bacterium]|nr:ATPase [Campylobacterales bacterium]
MSSQHPTLIQQFRSFCYQNNPKDLEEAIEYFAVFGGMGWKVDTSRPLIDLIEEKVLQNYTYIHSDITKMTRSGNVNHALLTGIAMGDRRTHSAFKRARISKDEGEEAIEDLCKSAIIEVEYSLESPPKPEDKVADRLLFTVPFMRFWFAFISPFFKGIKEGDYTEVKTRFANREQGFSDLIMQRLFMALLKKSFKEDPIVEIGSYWDRNVEIDILAKTKSGKIVAGSCKYAASKLKKSELTKLKEKCAIAELSPDICVLFSKNSFSNELKSLKSEELKLYSLKNFKSLIEDLNSEDLLQNLGKRY